MNNKGISTIEASISFLIIFLCIVMLMNIAISIYQQMMLKSLAQNIANRCSQSYPVEIDTTWDASFAFEKDINEFKKKYLFFSKERKIDIKIEVCESVGLQKKIMVTLNTNYNSNLGRIFSVFSLKNTQQQTVQAFGNTNIPTDFIAVADYCNNLMKETDNLEMTPFDENYQDYVLSQIEETNYVLNMLK